MRALLLLLVVLTACDVSTLNGTALLITAHVAGDAPIDQLRYRASDERGALTFGPETRPEVAAGRQPSTTAVRVLLPDSSAGQVIEVLVEGLISQSVVLEGRALARIERGREAAVTIELGSPGSGCSGCPGCCAGGACLSPSAAACGAACASCEAPASDSCGSQGACGCGAGPACGTGSQCVAGRCVCDSATCAGCCSDSGQCLGGTSQSSCGARGVACRSCSRRCRGGACE